MNLLLIIGLVFAILIGIGTNIVYRWAVPKQTTIIAVPLQRDEGWFDPRWPSERGKMNYERDLSLWSFSAGGRQYSIRDLMGRGI